MDEQRCSCGQTFTPNAPKQTKCNACRFVRPSTSRRPSGVPNPIQWCDIPGYEDRYEINTLGTIRVKSDGTYLSVSRGKSGFSVHLNDGQRRTHHPVHRLMLMAFKPIENSHLYRAVPENKNAHDLRLENWDWCPDDASARIFRATLTPANVLAIRAAVMSDSTLSYDVIGHEYSVRRAAIEKIINGRRWKHVR